MRQLILDTETTGLETSDDHRITEIGIVEVLNQIPTGRTYHIYLNPERPLDEAAIRITGLTNDFLADKPLFPDIAEEFLSFIENDPIVAHNASFDANFLNHELTRCGREGLQNEIIDTLDIAKKMFPGGRHSLDALCQRFEIDNSNRTLHGALLDAQILAEVYIELTGGRQADMLVSVTQTEEQADLTTNITTTPKTKREPRQNLGLPTTDERSAHTAFIQKIEGNFWTQN